MLHGGIFCRSQQYEPYIARLVPPRSDIHYKQRRFRISFALGPTECFYFLRNAILDTRIVQELRQINAPENGGLEAIGLQFRLKGERQKAIVERTFSGTKTKTRVRFVSSIFRNRLERGSIPSSDSHSRHIFSREPSLLREQEVSQGLYLQIL